MPASPTRATTAPAPSTPLPGTAALLVLLSGTFMVVLDFFIVNVALPSLQHELAASSAAVQLVVAGYGLANAAMLITGGRLGDLHGRRRVFLVGMALFTLSSAACGFAPNAQVLIAARIAQGAAGALLQPQVMAMLSVLYPGPARARAFAAYGLAMGLAAASGQIIGGLLIHANLAGLGWRTCFLINLPLGALALLLGPRVLPTLRAPSVSRLDGSGAVLVAASLCAAVLPLVLGREQGWPAWSLLLLACAAPLFALWWRHQRRTAARGGQPLVAPALLAVRPYRIGLGVTLAFFAGNASFYFVLALYLQQGLGLAPLPAGGVFTALAAGFFVASMASPAAARRLGGNAILLGTLVLAAGHALLLAVLALASDVALVTLMVPVLLLQGAGLGLVMAPLAAAVLAGAPIQHAGVASGVMATVQQMGNALGVALIGLLYYGALDAGTARGAASHALSASLFYLLALALASAWLYRRFTRSLESTSTSTSSKE